MEYIKNIIDIGTQEPFTILHVTDMHLTHVGLFDGRKLRKLSKKRKSVYPDSDKTLNAVIQKSKELNCPIINTGDMMDFNSKANLKIVKKFTDENDCLFIAGNHDFRPFGGMEYDVHASRERTLSVVQNAFKNDIRFSSKIINGVNFVSMDDVYYHFEESQFNGLKEEVKKGLPIVLLIHIPLYTPELYDLIVTGKRNFASMISVPEEKMQCYPEKRYKQQKEDALTHEVFEYIKSETAIKAILTGHVHKNFETLLDGRLIQYVTGKDSIREIYIK